MNKFYIVMGVADQDEIALIGPIDSQEEAFKWINEAVQDIPGWEELLNELDDAVPRLVGNDQSGIPITFYVREAHDSVASAYQSIGPGYTH